MRNHNKIWSCALALAVFSSGPVAGTATQVENPSQPQQIVSAATDITAVIAQAIAAFEATPRSNWSRLVERYENEEGDISSRVERYDASLPKGQRWVLLQLNGETPSDKEQRKYQQKRQKQYDKKTESQESNFSFSLKELIQIPTLTLESEDDNYLRANFKVSLSQLGDEASNHLQGLLTYNKQQQFIETIDIANTASFSPIFSAKISELAIQFNFQKIDASILPLSNNMTMKGSWAFFTEIDEVSKDTYSDYQYVPDTQTNKLAAITHSEKE